MHPSHALVVLAGLVTAPNRPDESAGPASVGRSVEVLSEVVATEHFRVRYRPGSRAGAGADRVLALLEPEYARILDTLEIRKSVDESQPFHLFLYDSVGEIALITGVEGSGGFSTARESHVPFDNDQTRMHELVHVVVAAMPAAGSEQRNMFLVEGVANAVLEFVHGVHVHAVAAFELERGSLPDLELLMGQDDYYRYLEEHPDFNGYDVGGSFMLFLLDRFDRRRVMRFYHGMPIQQTLGLSLKQVQRRWHEMLAKVEIRPELRTLLRERRGEEVEFTNYEVRKKDRKALPAELLGEVGDWVGLQAGLEQAAGPGTWALDQEVARGENPDGANWSILKVEGRTARNCILRASIRPTPACWGVQLRLGEECQAMVLGQGTFLYHRDREAAAFSGEHSLGGDEIELALFIRDGEVEVWVDGERVLAERLAVGSGVPGLGLVGGSAEFRRLSIRELD